MSEIVKSATKTLAEQFEAINERFVGESLARYCRLIDHETEVLEAIRSGTPLIIRKAIRIPIMVSK